MASYIQYIASDNSTVLLEVDTEEILPSEGTVKAGVGDTIHDTVAKAHATFEEALDNVVRQNAQALIQSVRKMTQPPDELEVNFSLKATGEVGNFAIAKGSGEANFAVRLLWKPELRQQDER